MSQVDAEEGNQEAAAAAAPVPEAKADYAALLPKGTGTACNLSTMGDAIEDFSLANVVSNT